ELGFRVVWLFCGDRPPPAIPGVQTHWTPRRIEETEAISVSYTPGG
ncbi:MAG: DUF58 domain-containing protein, partial [Chloroflexi bacterium]